MQAKMESLKWVVKLPQEIRLEGVIIMIEDWGTWVLMRFKLNIWGGAFVKQRWDYDDNDNSMEYWFLYILMKIITGVDLLPNGGVSQFLIQTTVTVHSVYI